jgi:hypothetical protein
MMNLKVVVACFRYNLRTNMEELRKTINYLRIAGCMAEIQTQGLPDVNQKCQPLDHNVWSQPFSDGGTFLHYSFKLRNYNLKGFGPCILVNQSAKIGIHLSSLHHC